MTDKEFRHLRRIELIEIIYKLQSNEAVLNKEIADLKQQLAARELKLKDAGSIAEAAMGLNDVFTSAQAAADQYLDQIRKMKAEEEGLLAAARAEAARIVREARQAAEPKREEDAPCRQPQDTREAQPQG